MGMPYEITGLLPLVEHWNEFVYFRTVLLIWDGIL